MQYETDFAQQYLERNTYVYIEFNLSQHDQMCNI